jgi:hypothetical protein
MTRPFLMRIDMELSNHLFEHRHAHGDAVFHLVENDGALESATSERARGRG